MEFENENTSPEKLEGYVHLKELSNSDYEIKDGEPDIIGWDIKNSEGRKLGEVDELIFDPQARKVRYIVLNMEGNETDLEDERRVLIPIGVAELYTDNDDVIIPQVTATQLSQLPPYEGCPELTSALEMDTRSVFEGSTGSTAPYAHPQFYEHEHFNEDKFYSRSNLLDNETLIPAENMDQAGDANRAERVIRIVDRIKHRNDDPA